MMSEVDPLDPNAFEIHRITVRDGTELAYVHEGIGGVPLLCGHGWPASKRIYYRNIRPLAEAGFEVVVPDISGIGDSPVRPDRLADGPSTCRDFVALMQALGHERWVNVGYDLSSVAMVDMLNRFPEVVIRQVLWNGLVPVLPRYDELGIGGDLIEEVRAFSTHIDDHGDDADTFAATFESPEARQEYAAGYYKMRVWKPGDPERVHAARGAFDDEEASFQGEPYRDLDKLRSSFHYYETFRRPELLSEIPLVDRVIETETMVLHGIEDEMISPFQIQRAEVGFRNLVGPFCVDRGGHFLSWERPAVVNSAIVAFCRDLLRS